MTKLAVVTFTRNLWPKWQQQCYLSIREALPSYGKHYVVDGRTHWQRLKWEALQIAEYVAFVDDDDLVEPWALDSCVKALDESGAGLAFTYEKRIDESGSTLSQDNRPLQLHDIFCHPRAAHHLSVLRRSSLEVKAIEAAENFGCGIDWFAKACATANLGAVQILKVGYQWRIHSGSYSQSTSEESSFKNNISKMRQLARTWVRPHSYLKHLSEV